MKLDRKSSLPTADNINQAHRLAKASAETAVQYAIQCGHLLLAKKADSEHGDFRAWVGKNCSFPQSTATLYMTAARQNANALAFSSLRSLFPSGREPKPKVTRIEPEPPTEKEAPKAAPVADIPKQEAAAPAAPEKPAAQPPAKIEPAQPAINLDEKWQPDDDEVAAHQLMERELAESTDKIINADDKLAAAHKEIKRQAAEIAMLKLRRDAYQNERVEAIQLCKKLQRENDNLKRQLRKQAA